MGSDRARIAVVGAGAAGLAAAHRLAARGASVVVLEERAHVGGRSWTDALDGYRVDAGSQLFGSMYTRFLALAAEVGLGRDLLRAPGRDALWRGGRAHEVVWGSVPSMVASGALPWGTKVRLGTAYVPFLTRHTGSLELHAPERASFAGLDGESIAEWGAREIGRDFVEYLVYPQLAAFHGSLPEETGAGFYHILARYGTDVTLYAVRGGAGRVWEAVAAAIRGAGGEVRTGAGVRRVDAREAVVAGEGWEERFDGVVLAVPAPVAAGLLTDAPAPLVGWLGDVRYRPAVSLALLLERPAGVRYFGLSLPREASEVVAAVCVQENKGAELVPPGRGSLVAFAAPAAAERLVSSDARDVLAAMRPDFERALPGVERSIVRARVYRWPHGHVVFRPGHLGRIAAFQGGGIEGDAPVALAGDYLLWPSVEGAVVSGQSAAERILARVARA